jgi:hypothetical protein
VVRESKYTHHLNILHNEIWKAELNQFLATPIGMFMFSVFDSRPKAICLDIFVIFSFF